MPLLPTTRRTAAPALLTAALLLAAGHSPAQDKELTAEEVLAKVKAGSPGFDKLREKLAADPVGSRVRIDGFAAKDAALEVSGVILVPGSNDEEKGKAETAAREKVAAAVRDVTGAKDFKAFDFTAVKYARGERMPHLALQKAANDAGKTAPAADELMLSNSKFDAKGQLIVTGLRGNDSKTIDWLASAVTNSLKDNPAALTADGKRAPVTFALGTPGWFVDWPMSPAAIQRVVGRSPNPVLNRLRVDRAYLASSPVAADESNPGGVLWRYVVSGIAVGDRPDPQAIAGAVNLAAVGGFWDPIKEGDVADLTDKDNRIDDPAPHFQRAIAARPALDGVRIDARTGFGPGGELVLAGLQPGLSAAQLEELDRTVRGVIGTLSGNPDSGKVYRRVLDRGLSTSRLDPVQVRALHADLRAWAGATLDDVRLSRLYFDPTGRLTLTCEAPDDAAKAAVERELVARAARVVPGLKAADLPAPKELPKDEKKGDKEEKKDPGAVVPFSADTVPVAARLAQEPTKTDPTAPPQVAFSKFRGSLTRFLQEVVADPKNTQWYALLVERGLFNGGDEYTVRGVANSEEQKKAFAEYLASLKADARWAEYFTPKPPAPLDEKTFPVIPMAKLEERARRVMPAYPVFDGTRVTKARYEFVSDPKNPGQRLVFDAHVVGRLDPKAAEKLTELIAADDEYYGRRLPKGRLVGIRALPPDAAVSALTEDQLADFAQGFGAYWLGKGEAAKATDWIDRGLLHAPHVSAEWFLSAYYNHLRGDLELVRRDLFRIIPIEDPLAFDGPNQRKRRYAAAKDLQGEKRDELEKIWLQCWKEYKDGVRPMTFAEPKK